MVFIFMAGLQTGHVRQRCVVDSDSLCCLLARCIEAPCPADLQHAIVNFPRVMRSFEECDSHGVILIYMAMKQGPARDAFFEQWQACDMGPKGKHGHPGCDRWLAKLCGMLARTATNMEGVDLQIWSDNTNRGVGHHSGWLPYLQTLGIIKKVVKTVKATKTVKNVKKVKGIKTIKGSKTLKGTKKRAKTCKGTRTGKGNKLGKQGRRGIWRRGV